jgi:TM2 domain-containing membrane protein YozV
MLLIWFASLNATTSSPLIEPKIEHTVHERYLKSLSSPFTPLTPEEKETQWGSEYTIGIHFAKNLDFYRAITAFRRAEILTTSDERKIEAQYETLLNYYLGKRYPETETAFDESDLKTVSINFPAFHDLLVILYDTYLHLDHPEKAAHVLNLTAQYFPETHKNLLQYTSLKEVKPSNHPIWTAYQENKKSPLLAPLLNALIPGTGYLYLGQIQTAITALLVNGLFIAAAIFFFKRKAYAAALIFLSFEAGWYFGGIHGGKRGAKFYNERVYEQIATPYMNREGIFPIYQLKHAF